MKVVVKRPHDLSADDFAAWTALRAGNPALYSPYFHPEYTLNVALHVENAYVALALMDNQPVAILPFQTGQQHGGFARPIGAPMTDYQGFIQAADSTIDHTQMLQQADIGAFYFDGLVAGQNDIAQHFQSREDICCLSLRGSAQNWRDSQSKSYRRHLKSHRRRVRKSDAEIGRQVFDFNCEDDAVFAQLFEWKRQKFEATGKYDVTSTGWTHALLTGLWKSESKLRCAMHALYFGDKLAAVDLGLTDGDTFHSWIVSYNPDFHTYAPGIQLLEGLLDAANDLGYQRIDLGPGLEGYKRHYSNTDAQVGQGFIAARGPAAALSRIYGAAEKFGEKALGDAPGKIRRRYSQIAACDESLSGRAKAILQAVSGPATES